MWIYLFEGEVIAQFKRDDTPCIGAPITFVGRLGIKAKAENFEVISVDCANKSLGLARC